MKATILITLIALLGSSVALTLSRAEPRPKVLGKPDKFDPSKYDHIFAEVRPLGVKQSQLAMDIAPHHPEPQNQHVEVEIKQPSPHVELEIKEAEKPHHFNLTMHGGHQPHHKPEHHLVDVEFHHHQPPQHVELEIMQTHQQPQHVDLEIKQADRYPQQVQIDVQAPIIIKSRRCCTILVLDLRSNNCSQSKSRIMSSWRSSPLNRSPNTLKSS